MFDSHEEFNEWFSRDIESHAEKKSALDESQLSRLHMILKPFMLRRIKRDVEHEMAEKVKKKKEKKNLQYVENCQNLVFGLSRQN